MLKQFYEKALPSQGVYCVSGLSNGRMANRFAETLDGVLEEIEKLKVAILKEYKTYWLEKKE